jgi:hypothetical protein
VRPPDLLPGEQVNSTGHIRRSVVELEVPQVGNLALAEIIAVIDTSAAAIRVLNKVIVVLRIVVLCGEFALAITAALLRTLPADFVDKSSLGISQKSPSEHHANLALLLLDRRIMPACVVGNTQSQVHCL